MLDPDNPDLDAALDAIPDNPEPAPSGGPAVVSASAPAPSPAAPAQASESEAELVLRNLIQLSSQFGQLVPGRHLLISDLINTARKLLRTFDQVTLWATPEGLEMLMKAFHPSATEAEIKSALWAAYQEGTAA